MEAERKYITCDCGSKISFDFFGYNNSYHLECKKCYRNYFSPHGSRNYYNVTGWEQCFSCNGSGTKTYYGDTPSHSCNFCGGVGYNAPESGGCFITTAVCSTIGKNDDCYELMTYRSFRDNWLSKTIKGREKIETYYSIAPKIVAEIDKKSNSSDIYKFLWDKYLSKGLILLENKRYVEAIALYENMLKYIIQYLEKNKIDDDLGTKICKL